MNRHTRRALAKSDAGNALRQLEGAVSALQGTDFKEIVADLKSVQAQVAETHQIVTALVDDCQALSDAADLQRRVFIRMLAEYTGDVAAAEIETRCRELEAEMGHGESA